VRPRPVDLMLLATVVLWALNLTVSRFILLHGFRPLAYSTVRYGLAAALFAGITVALERRVGFARADVGRVVAAAALLVVNQLAFVYALDRATASTVGLILGATPIFAGAFGVLLGLERLPARFWAGAGVSFAGVALVALGAHGAVDADLLGVLFGLATAATWAGYSVVVAPLMERYSPARISTSVLGLTWLGVAAVGAPQWVAQDYGLSTEVWLLLAFSVVGPLVLTNVLWFTALHRVGPGRATLAANLQPFVAAVLGIVLLDESLSASQALGGLLIAAGIALVVRRRRAGAAVPQAE
jgi:drug/metabolite transporter (DMT)-like permease